MTMWLHSFLCLSAGLGFAFAAPAMAQPATLLTQVEAHCIQPGKPAAHFVAAPNGWSRMRPEGHEEAVVQGTTPSPIWYAVREFDVFDTDALYDDYVKSQALEATRDRVRDLGEGEAALLAHHDGARLLVFDNGEDWRNLSCTFWHPSPAAPLHAAIIARWQVPPLHTLKTPYGQYSGTTVFMRRNDTPFELGAEVIQPTSVAGRMPVILELKILPI